MGGDRQLGQGDVEACLAVRVGRGGDVERLARGFDRVVLEPEGVAGEGGEAVHRLDVEIARDGQIRRRGAVEIARRQVDGDRRIGVKRLGGTVEFDRQPLRLEVLDQNRGLGDGRALGIGIKLRRPRAAHGVGGKRHVLRIAAEAAVAERLAQELDAVRPLDHQGHRQVGDGIGARVAHQCRQVDRLARPVDAALRGQEHVERLRCRPSGNAAIGEIEGGAGEIEEGIVAVGLGNHQLRGHAAVAARQAGIEAGIAGIVGDRCPENVVVDRDELQLDAGHRLGGGQRAHDGVDAVMAGERGEAEIGDDEPLGGERAPLAGVVGRGLRGDDIGAGLHLRHRIGDRNRRDHGLVELRGDVDLALPHLLAGLVGDLLGRVAGKAAEETAVAHGGGNAAVADAVDHCPRLVGIDRAQRNRGTGAGGQNIGVAGEADPGGAVAHIDREFNRGRQRLAVGGRQTGAYTHHVAAAVLDAVDADLALLRLDGEPVAAFDLDEIGKVRARDGELVGEDDANLRGRAVRLDIVGDDAEAVLGGELVIGGTHAADFGQRQAGTIGADGGLPLLALGQAAAGKRQRHGARLLGVGPQITVDRRGAGIAGRLLAIGIAVRRARQAGTGEVEPGDGFVTGDGERLAEGDGGLVIPAGTHGGGAGGPQRAVADAGNRKAVLERADQRTRLVDEAGGQEVQFGQPLTLQRRRQRDGLDDAAGDRIRCGGERAEVGLEEAPLGLRIEGEGAAGRVGETGSLAARLIDILHRLHVEAGIIGVRRDDDPLAGGQGR